LISALVIVLGAVVLRLLYRRDHGRQLAGGRIGILGLNLFLIAGLILSPSGVLGLGNNFFDCGGTDVLASYQKAGTALSQVIPPGSKIYWEGRIPAIFLYLPPVKVYPPQLNHVHSYYVGGDPNVILRYSHWNDELARQWLADADYILVQNTEKVYLTDDMLKSGAYEKVFSAPKAEKCRWQSVIQVYQRVGASK
jgi:hypothetical protein